MDSTITIASSLLLLLFTILTLLKIESTKTAIAPSLGTSIQFDTFTINSQELSLPITFTNAYNCVYLTNITRNEDIFVIQGYDNNFETNMHVNTTVSGQNPTSATLCFKFNEDLYGPIREASMTAYWC